MNKTIRLAQSFATLAHRGQTDLAGHPYIDHPARVAAHLERLGAPVEVVAAGWLHDVVEDSAFTVEDIRRSFGDDVAHLVDLLTRRDDQTYEEYLERVCGDLEAVLIKLTDVSDNADPSRLAQLDWADGIRLACKYAHAMERLKEASRVHLANA